MGRKGHAGRQLDTAVLDIFFVRQDRTGQGLVSLFHGAGAEKCEGSNTSPLKCAKMPWEHMFVLVLVCQELVALYVSMASV